MPAGWIEAGTALYGAYQSSQKPKGGQTGNTAQGYVPTGLDAADTGWQQNQQTNQGQLNYGGGFANQVDPNLHNSYQQLSNINYNPYLQASQEAGGQYGQLAHQAGQAGQQMGQQSQNNFNQQQSLDQAGQQLWNTAQDPQHALYNQQYQQTTDQSAATNSMYGLGSSGQGAALTQQAQGNFNMNWENQQLARQAQGLQGMSQANQSGIQSGSLGAADQQASMGYYGQQPGYTQQAAQTPINAQQWVGQQGFNNAQGYGTALGAAMAPYNQQENQAIPYMNYGSGAGANAYQNSLAGQKQQGQQLGQLGSALGNVNWGSLGSMFGGSNSSGSASGVPSGYTSYNDPSWANYTGG